MNALSVRLRDLPDVDFSPGRKLYPVFVTDAGRFLAPHEVEEAQIGLRSRMLGRRAFIGLGAAAALALILRPDFVMAANRTAWTAGNGVGLTWGSFISTAGVATLASTDSIMDGTDQTNGSALDIFADISHAITISSNTIAAGANIAYWLYYLNQDGTTYGDNHQSTTASATGPTAPPVAAVPCFAAATQTSIIGNATGLVLAPGTFRGVVQNNCGFAFTAATIKYRTYNTNLNN